MKVMRMVQSSISEERSFDGHGTFGSLFAGLLCVCLAAVSSGFAQERTGALSGVVKDQSGGVLPSVTITATNKVTNRSVSTKTGEVGSYLFRELEPGRYTLKFELTGFSNSFVEDVIVLLGKNLEANTSLRLGAVEQVVGVSGSATLIDMAGTTILHNVTAEEFDRMPKARSFQDVALTSPSVNSGQIEGGIQVNGASAAENNFIIDGLSVTGIIHGNSRQDAVYEFLQEVEVKTSGLEAEFGGALGGVISAVTKSGGNAFHGELHWYNSGSPFSAGLTPRLQISPVDEISTQYFQDGEIKDHINEVGGSLGGPLLRNKLYFFTAITPQWQRQEENVLFDSGQTPSVFTSSRYATSMFNKLSWDATSHIRTNFSWLYTTQKATGLLPAFDAYCASCNVNSVAANESNRKQGWYLPQNSYTGTVDVTLSSTSLLSLRGGYFWDNYKDTNAPSTPQVAYRTSATDLPFDIPEELQQPNRWFNVPLTEVNNFDITSRGFFQGDYSKMFHFGGTHNLKGGAGIQKVVNKVDVNYQGGYQTSIFWDSSFTSSATGQTDRGIYGYYRVQQYGTQGSAGSTIDNMYIQDQWQIHPRLTLSLGLRTEKENIPSFYRDVRDFAMQFGWSDKLAPRLGASLDLLGNGRMKVFGSWGRYFDWTKYQLVRGSFGGDTWKDWWYSLDTLDIFSLGLNNLQGRNLWSNVPGSFQDHRVPSFEADSVDPNIKPMHLDSLVAGAEYQLSSELVISAHYVRTRLNRTIEDIGRLVDGNETYTLGNPGEGRFATETNHYGATPDFPMPKPDRRYDALELSLNRRFANGWFLGGNYTFSRLYGNYAGLSSTSEIVNGGLPNTGWSAAQTPYIFTARPGGNTNRDYDADLILFDSHGQYLTGRLETDRPHVLKLYGSYKFKWGTELGGRFYAASGTPITTRVEELNQIPLFVNGRADAGRTPLLNQTDLLVSHNFKLGETRRLVFEFNIINLFNQKTARYVQNVVTRYQDSSSAMDMSQVNLLKGYDWRALLSQTAYAQDSTRSSDPNSLDPTKNWAVDPTYGKYDVYNPGFSGRFAIRLVF
jgi:hypothetical protein